MHRRRISSSIGNVGFDVEDQGSVVIDDESDWNNPEERLNKARQVEEEQPPPRQQEEIVNRPAVNRFEFLIGMARAVKEVKVGENTFVLKTLKSKENKEIFLSVVGAKNAIEEMYLVRAGTLARAIHTINGIPFERVINANDLKAKMEFIDEMQEAVLNLLFKEYNVLKDGQIKDLDKVLGENTQEVIETIKK